MPNDTTSSQSVRRPSHLAQTHRTMLIVTALIVVLFASLIGILTYRSALLASHDQATIRLTAQMQGLSNSLEKYRLLTPLIARRPDLLALLSANSDDDDLETALAAIGQIGVMSGAYQIEVTYPDGTYLTVLDDTPSEPHKSPQKRLQRTDIVTAFQGRLGRHFTQTGNQRFYTFSSAARIDGILAGIVSIKIDLSSIEQIWALSTNPIAAAANGEVLLANREGWYGAHFTRSDKSRSTNEAASSLILLWQQSTFGPALVSLASPSGTLTSDQLGAIEEGQKPARDYVAAIRHDPLLGWTFYAMEPLNRTYLLAATATFAALLLGGLILGALWVLFNRQTQQLTQRRRDRASALRLERKVRDRTKELRQTQAGLIHSAKLAAIGQMSAVLSHEYNQPLAAIRSYSDNAALLFEKGRMDQGFDNLTRIGKLVDRLASLSKTLKTFARRPGVDTKPVHIGTVVDEATMLMLPQTRKAGVTLINHKSGQDIYVQAGQIRLEQVLINLISNALDALVQPSEQQKTNDQNRNAPTISIETFIHNDQAVMQVSDNGPGITPEIAQDIFEPFTTSKEAGVGLGLGLPIAYNLIKGFGGALEVIQAPDPSMTTCFEIRLPLTKVENGTDFAS